MSSAEIAARSIKELSMEEVKVLKIFSRLIYEYEAIDEDTIAMKSEMHMDRIRFALSRLNEKNLIFKVNKGYILLTSGLDAIALKMLADKGIVYGLGKPIGIGKESDVFEGITATNERVAIKFFRIGRISFRDIRKRGFNAHTWLTINIEAAKHEFAILKRLYLAMVKVPKPIANIKHLIVMQLIEGNRLRFSMVEDPKHVLSLILDEIRLAYKNGVISADLSDYNVLYDGKDIWLIDFPQAVGLDHPNADLLLRRDLKNILRYFKKRYDIEYDIEKCIHYIQS